MAYREDADLHYDDSDSSSDSTGTIPNRMPFTFGVEIELIMRPKTIFDQGPDFLHVNNDDWRQRLADKINQKKALHAVASKRPKEYDRWFITKDGSLSPGMYEVALEAVSPKMCYPWRFEKQIDRFWEATNELFDVQRNTRCGSHVHVAPMERRYKLWELLRIAYAVATQEEFVLKILPEERLDNEYGRPSSVCSADLRTNLDEGRRDSPTRPFRYVVEKLQRINSIERLVKYMQGGGRYVLWNFQNTLKDSGTVEFRGGRHLRGPVRTKRWVAFVVSFIDMAIEDKQAFRSSAETNIDNWWEKIYSHSIALDLHPFLPENWKSMRDRVD